MRARHFAGTFLLGLATSLLVALVLERLRASGSFAPPPGAFPRPVAPGANTV